MNHQELPRNVHCVVTVVLRKQLNFKSAVIRFRIFLVNRAAMGRARFLFFMSLILVLLLTSAKIPLARPDIESHNL